MSTMVLVTAPVKPEELYNLKALWVDILPGTRAYDGCQGVEAYFDQNHPNSVALVEFWDSPEHHQRYIQWRTETGVMDAIGATLAGPPNIQYCEKLSTG